MDKTVEAEAAYRQCLRLNPDYPEALNNLSFLLTESHGGGRERLEEAAALAQKAVRASRGNISSSDTLGLIYLKQNRTESARQLFSTLLARDPHNPMLHIISAWFCGRRATGNSTPLYKAAFLPRNDKPLGNCYQENKRVLVQAGL